MDAIAKTKEEKKKANQRHNRVARVVRRSQGLGCEVVHLVPCGVKRKRQN